jgi:methionyl-tRNA formyltransferase
MTPIVLGYFGDGPWAHNALDRLLSDPTVTVAFICARYPNPDEVLRSRARQSDIPFFAHADVNSNEFLQAVRAFNCDLFVSMSFNQILRRQMIREPRLGTINCHAGKLPFYRGRNVLNWALINDEKTFGITVHHVDEGIDTGDIIAQREYAIDDTDTYASLLERAYIGCAELLFDAVKQLQSGRARRTPQSEIHPCGFYCTVRKPGDERIDWKQSSRDVFNLVRAISRPGPEARTFLGDKEVKINRVEFLPDAPSFKGIPGAVVGVEDGGFLVKTADSYIKVVEWSGVVKLRIGDRLS